MCNLESMNYIHTLFVCEFQTTHNIASLIRNILLKDKKQPHLWYNYIHRSLANTKLPQFEEGPIKEKPQNYFKKIGYINLMICSGERKLCLDFLVHSFYIRFEGIENKYALSIRIIDNEIVFIEQRWNCDPYKIIAFNSIREDEYRNKIENILRLTKTMNEIPFAELDVK